MHRTHFWNNLHQDQSLKSRKPNNLKSLGRRPKDLRLETEKIKLAE